MSRLAFNYLTAISTSWAAQDKYLDFLSSVVRMTIRNILNLKHLITDRNNTSLRISR